MNQADVSRLVSKLRIKIAPRHRNLKNPDGPEGRLLKLRKTVTGLVKHERIELNWNRADEARGYVERLISDAIRHGDCHRTTMEMADYWLLEKQLVHKLFKVLVPRFENCTTSYTRLIKASMLTGHQYPRAVLELRGHPYPPLFVDTYTNRNLLHNVLLEEARKEYREKKYAEMAETLKEQEKAAENLQSAAATVEAVEATAESTTEAESDHQAESEPLERENISQEETTSEPPSSSNSNPTKDEK